jgi:hypothetical protein
LRFSGAVNLAAADSDLYFSYIRQWTKVNQQIRFLPGKMSGSAYLPFGTPM